ncbi:MAG: hypothetical protein LBK53_09220 [Heliobacteriaceae bacterium]|jgi:hypothetical protein|nr:hypothetical protein [Heliobacteriaceae bacterium]
MNLEIIKPKSFTIKIGKTIYPLRYDLRAFAFIEENLNSVNEAVSLFNEKDLGAIAVMFQAGLLHVGADAYKLLKKVNLEELIRTIAKAISEVTCSDYGFDKEFDWSLLYFIAKPALNFSEEEFWNSTPKKILTMMKMLEEMRKGKSTEILTDNEAAKAFMSW